MFIIPLWLTLLRSKSYITVVMPKSFVILLLLGAVTIGAACQTTTQPTPTPTLTPSPTPTVTPTPVITPTPTPNEIDLLEFLNTLLQVSKPFAEFYGNEIKPLNAEIHWFYDPNLSTAFAYTMPSADYKAANITLRRIPNSNEGNASLNKDAFLIAHELASLVVGPKLQKDWDIQYYDGKPAAVFGIFLNAIRAPLRDKILAQYNFDVGSNFQSDLDIFTSVCIDPTDPLIKHEYAFAYVYFVLYWQYVLNHDGIPPELDTFCQNCCPDVQQEGINVLTMVDGVGGIGSITSDSAKVLMQEIIDKYNFPCRIVTFSQTQ